MDKTIPMYPSNDVEGIKSSEGLIHIQHYMIISNGRKSIIEPLNLSSNSCLNERVTQSNLNHVMDEGYLGPDSILDKLERPFWEYPPQ